MKLNDIQIHIHSGEEERREREQLDRIETLLRQIFHRLHDRSLQPQIDKLNQLNAEEQAKTENLNKAVADHQPPPQE